MTMSQTHDLLITSQVSKHQNKTSGDQPGHFKKLLNSSLQSTHQWVIMLSVTTVHKYGMPGLRRLTG